MSNAVVIAQGRQYRAELEAQKENLVLRPIGEITEDTMFGEILNALQTHLKGARTLLIDLGSVTRINSCGVREWILFLERVQSKVPIAFSMVNEFFVDQASVVPTLLGKRGTSVLKFHGPYRCPRCNVRSQQVLQSESLNPAEPKAPDMKCDRCGGALEFDALEEEYFAFLRHSRPVAQG